MRHSIYSGFTAAVGALLALSVICTAASAAGAESLPWKSPFDIDASSGPVQLAESDRDAANEEEPRSGSLVMPATAEKDEGEKKCMTVCQRWGESCMIDSVRGVRKCRRTCKEFGQECF